jgi:predicted CoA-substrate-specific enzyme activase
MKVKVCVGLDIGSTFTKVCVMSPDGEVISLSSFVSPVNQKTYFEHYISTLRNTYDIMAIAACGYGKGHIDAATTLSELIALAKGLSVVSPHTNMALDIGGQDTKVILCHNGKLARFVLNDQCAAGSGLFLQNALRMLDIDFGDLRVIESNAMPLTTVCAVFGQTEIVRAISKGISREKLSQSVLLTIAQQAISLLNQLDRKQLCAFTGGLSLIPGMCNLLNSTDLSGGGRDIFIPDHASFLAAIGCAHKAGEQII